MNAQEKAEKVAEIARAYGYRMRHGISHSEHTRNRLLDAVSELLGYRVVVLNHYTARLGQDRVEG